jgi:hypothetical protein
MKSLQQFGVLVGLALGFLFWLRACHDPGIRRDAAAVATLDSARAQAQVDAAAAAARDSTARADSAHAATQLAGAHRTTVALAAAANALVPRVRAAVLDSMQPVFDALVRAKDSTVAATAHERDLEHARWVQAVGELAYQRDTVVPKLRKDRLDALQQVAAALKRVGRHWHVGAGLGYGATAHGGQVYAGPALTLGLVYTP